MPSWLSSIESLIRAVTLLSWMGIGFAVLAAACGAAALYLNRQASNLWEERLKQDVAASASQLEESQQEQLDELNQELRDTRELLLASEERSEGFLDRIESLQQELQGMQRSRARQSRTRPQPQSPPQVALATPDVPSREAQGDTILTPEQVEKIRNSMAGKPTGEITLVTVVGQPRSAQLGKELGALLSELGWQVTVIQGVFPTPPQESSFVFHSRESIPGTASALSVALAMADLMSLPSKVTINPARPAGFLGLIVAPGR